MPILDQSISGFISTQNFNIGTISGLAIVNALNPCQMAVLLMVLLSILTHDPKNKKKILYAGFAFAFAVFITYILYGTIIIQFFTTFTEFTKANAVLIYRGLAVLAMVIGALQIKDYFFYKPGGIATEMPLWMRPYTKLTISKVTSVSGAFIAGILVTLFLLPCTMGPYFIASLLLAKGGILAATPWLIYYNLIFISPMILITLLVYFGFSRVEKISGWKDKHVKMLHLIAGIIIFVTGISILLGWI